jgi:hypothetical protein
LQLICHKLKMEKMAPVKLLDGKIKQIEHLGLVSKC